MFIANFCITNSILKNIGIIEASREIIENSPLIPAWETKLKKEALEQTIHHSTHIEGNKLNLEEVQNILDGKEVTANEKDIQEILNYKNTLKFADQIVKQIGSPPKDRSVIHYLFSLETILDIHRLLTHKTLDPEKSGEFRTIQVIIRNSHTGHIAFTPPPAVEIPFLVEDLISWINSLQTKDIHPVLKSGIIHYELSRLHPFIEGNGKTARVVADLILGLDGYGLHKFSSVDEYFDQDPLQYFHTIQAVSNQPVLDSHERDLTPWLEYFTQGVAIEFHHVKERVKRISADTKVKDKLGEQVQLNERQMLIMEFLHRHKEMKNKDFRKIFPDFSDDTVLREMRFLKKKGLIRKIGGTKKAIYVLK